MWCWRCCKKSDCVVRVDRVSFVRLPVCRFSDFVFAVSFSRAARAFQESRATRTDYSCGEMLAGVRSYRRTRKV